ncbi:hypothetical protein DFP72DRAFT_427697 [Ephemerocybe angulata]|uniref:Uncharacterized protein n=1 Tax=Ephemerocybe angulata TaxID=980116 RepID=A0A8H6HU60_9AGAR|nr:hypothetical protein DFP72DRAFT_427611 [Tulosesus angulatus]KAF6753273.1 hypothetical protein DFP72DRAFT_427697 [Tulosesus angulatus]
MSSRIVRGGLLLGVLVAEDGCRSTIASFVEDSPWWSWSRRTVGGRVCRNVGNRIVRGGLILGVLVAEDGYRRNRIVRGGLTSVVSVAEDGCRLAFVVEMSAIASSAGDPEGSWPCRTVAGFVVETSAIASSAGDPEGLWPCRTVVGSQLASEGKVATASKV